MSARTVGNINENQNSVDGALIGTQEKKKSIDWKVGAINFQMSKGFNQDADNNMSTRRL